IRPEMRTAASDEVHTLDAALNRAVDQGAGLSVLVDRVLNARLEIIGDRNQVAHHYRFLCIESRGIEKWNVPTNTLLRRLGTVSIPSAGAPGVVLARGFSAPPAGTGDRPSASGSNGRPGTPVGAGLHV